MRELTVGRPDRARLFGVASGQCGYFTSAQARECGYDRALLSYHVKGGRLVRVRRGLYRLREYPSSSREQVIAAWLAVGKDIAVVSHLSALALLGLSDTLPAVVDLTVPRSRRSVPRMTGVKIHTTLRSFDLADLTVSEGLPVTSPARSIIDAAEAGATRRQIETAVARALVLRLVSAKRIQQAAGQRAARTARLVSDAVKTATMGDAGQRGREEPGLKASTGGERETLDQRREGVPDQGDRRIGQLRAYLSAIPSSDRELLLLVFVEGRSVAEIARIKGETPAQVGAAIVGALKRLRSIMSDGITR